MRALGAGHERAPTHPRAEHLSRLVDPGARRIHHRFRRHGQTLSSASSSTTAKPSPIADDLGIVERHACRREPRRVEQQFDAEPLGKADPGIVIGRREFQRGIETRPLPHACAARREHGAATVAGAASSSRRATGRSSPQPRPGWPALRKGQENRPLHSSGPRRPSGSGSSSAAAAPYAAHWRAARRAPAAIPRTSPNSPFSR